MPPPLPLSSERLERHGLYLIEDGQTMFLWIGRDAVPQLVADVFNLPSYEVLRGGKVRCSDCACKQRSAYACYCRQRCLCSTTPSASASTPSSRRRGRCVGAHTGPTSTSSRRTASPPSGCGPSAASSRTARMSCRVTSSSSRSSRIRCAVLFLITLR